MNRQKTPGSRSFDNFFKKVLSIKKNGVALQQQWHRLFV